LALVFHELATNSMKYGALSVPAGKVSVQWSLGETSILLRWQETGGPEIAGPPAQLGFGSFLLGKAVTAQLDAKLDHLWREEGLQVDVKLPLGDAFRSS
jgi:two-component sensor histidine kinase